MMTYRYYIFYLKSDKSIYAYTSSKEDRDLFELTRDMSKFKLKTENLEKEDVAYITEHFRHNIITKFHFKLNREGDDIVLPITELEKLNIEKKGYQLAYVDIFASAWIPCEIFVDDVQESLNDIYYTYCDYVMRTKSRRPNMGFEPDLLSIFIQDHLWSLDFSKLNNLYRKELKIR